MRPRIETVGFTFFLVVPMTNGTPDLRVELSPEGLTGLARDIAERFEAMRQDPDHMKKVGASLVSGLVDLFAKGKG
ncbi:MAG TPA: hypothetical protein VGI10_10085 [Polyangiaceae bacterium]|jgi:hypothetical protein